MVTGRNENLTGRIRLGMVGGGNDAFIGGVHRIASLIDDQFGHRRFVTRDLFFDFEHDLTNLKTFPNPVHFFPRVGAVEPKISTEPMR